MTHRIYPGKSVLWLLAPAIFLLILTGWAQSSGRQTPLAPGSCPMCPATMTQQNMPMHQDMAKLIDQVEKSAIALQKETNPVALKKKIADHVALVKELQEKFQQCSEHCNQMMQMGPGSMGDMGKKKL